MLQPGPQRTLLSSRHAPTEPVSAHDHPSLFTFLLKRFLPNRKKSLHLVPARSSCRVSTSTIQPAGREAILNVPNVIPLKTLCDPTRHPRRPLNRTQVQSSPTACGTGCTTDTLDNPARYGITSYRTDAQRQNAIDDCATFCTTSASSLAIGNTDTTITCYCNATPGADETCTDATNNFAYYTRRT